MLQAWLRSGGEPALVKDGYATWIATHDGRNPIAWHVRQAWSRARGEIYRARRRGGLSKPNFPTDGLCCTGVAASVALGRADAGTAT